MTLNIKQYLCCMEQKRKYITCLLLILYTVVLLHNSIAHRYDCEILNTLFSCNKECICDSHQETKIHEHCHHFNIFSNDINLCVKKQIVATDCIFPAIPIIDSFYLACGKRKSFSHHYCYTQPYSIFFSLRSPPLA